MQQRRANDKVRLSVGIEVFPSGNGVAKGLKFLPRRAFDGKEQKASLPAENEDLGFSGRTEERIGNPIAVDITRVCDGKPESGIRGRCPGRSTTE